MLQRASCAGLGILVATLFSQPAPAQPIQDTWGTDGTVNTVFESGGTVYVGGNFSCVGPAYGGLVRLDLATGAVDTEFPRLHGTVRQIIPDGAGGWYIGGEFTHVAGLPRSNLAHIASDFRVTDWAPDTDDEVLSMQLVGTTVYVSGGFTKAGGATRNRVAALDAVTGAATAWDPNADEVVHDLAVDGSLVYLGGEFQNVGGQARNYFAAVDAATGLATSWDPDPNFYVYSVEAIGGLVYLGGYFSSIAGESRDYLVSIDPATGVLTSWAPDPSLYVTHLIPNGSTMFVMGAFSTITGVARVGIAEIDLATGSATPWNPQPNTKPFQTVLPVGSDVIVGGPFTQVGGQPGWRSPRSARSAGIRSRGTPPHAATIWPRCGATRSPRRGATSLPAGISTAWDRRRRATTSPRSTP